MRVMVLPPAIQKFKIVFELCMHKVAVIIPAFNEEKTIRAIVSVAKLSSLVSEVIVVSDGSNDHTAEYARQSGADKVIECRVNRGKAETLATGINATSSEIIVFLDADVLGLTTQHIDTLIAPVLSRKCSMHVGLRDRSWLYRKLGKFLPLISGERAFVRSIFTHLNPYFLSGFRIEVGMNAYCRVHQLRVCATVLREVTIRKKYQKVKLHRALFQYVRMTQQVISAYLYAFFN